MTSIKSQQLVASVNPPPVVAMLNTNLNLRDSTTPSAPQLLPDPHYNVAPIPQSMPPALPQFPPTLLGRAASTGGPNVYVPSAWNKGLQPAPPAT